MFAGHKLRRAGGFDLDFADPSQISSTANLATYTFSATTIPNPHPHRMVVIGVCGGATGGTIDSVTIGGETMSFVQQENSAGFAGVAWLSRRASRTAYARSWMLDVLSCS